MDASTLVLVFLLSGAVASEVWFVPVEDRLKAPRSWETLSPYEKHGRVLQILILAAVSSALLLNFLQS